MKILQTMSCGLGLLVWFGFQPVYAELKIGFVNAVRIMDEAPQVENASSRLEKEFAPRQKTIKAKVDSLRRLENKLNRDGEVMSEKQARDLERDIITRRRELKRDQDEFREDYSIRRNEELGKLQKQVIQEIQKFAQREDYDLILSEGVVYASNSVDITDKILRRLGR